MFTRNTIVSMTKQPRKQTLSVVLENKNTFENTWSKHIDEYDVYGTTVKRKLYETDSKDRYFHIYHSIVKEGNERTLLSKKIRQMKAYLNRNTNKVMTFGSGIKNICRVYRSDHTWPYL